MLEGAERAQRGHGHGQVCHCGRTRPIVSPLRIVVLKLMT